MASDVLKRAARRGLALGGEADPRLVVRARGPARGVEQGRHRTGALGSSTEFYDYRPYEAGDPLTRVDWRLYGRTDRHFVRRFQHDARLTISVVLDASRSMDFRGFGSGSGAPEKLALGVTLGGATLALGARQGDRVGATIVDGVQAVRHAVPSVGRRGLVRGAALLGRVRLEAPGALVGSEEDESGAWARGLGALLDGPDPEARRGVIVLIGDGHEPVERLAGALSRARGLGASVVLLRTLTPDEIEPGLSGARTLVDPERGSRARVESGRALGAALRRHADELAQLCRRTGAHLVRARTDDDPARALRRAFAPGCG